MAPRVQAHASHPDASLPLAQRIENLLRRMTLEEKVGQMNMPCVYEPGFGKTTAAKTEAVQKFAAGAYVKGLGPGGGFFTLPNTILHEWPAPAGRVPQPAPAHRS